MSLGALLDAGADQGGALRGLCYGLAGVYALLSAWALFKLLQLWRAAAGRHAGSGRCCACCGGWSSQRTLHALVLGVGVVRVAFFAVVPDWSSDFFYGRISGLRSESWQFVLDEVPSLLLVSLTSSHVLIWSRAYHTFRHEPETFRSRVRRGVLWANVALWFTQLSLWAAFEAYPPSADGISLASALMHVAAFTWLALTLSYYARGLSSQYMSIPMSLARRMARARELSVIAGVITACFLLRSGAILAISISTAVLDQGFDGLVDATSPWEVAFTATFFLVLEALPLALLLWHHRRVAVVPRMANGAESPSALLRKRLSLQAAAIKKGGSGSAGAPLLGSGATSASSSGGNDNVTPPSGGGGANGARAPIATAGGSSFALVAGERSGAPLVFALPAGGAGTGTGPSGRPSNADVPLLGGGGPGTPERGGHGDAFSPMSSPGAVGPGGLRVSAAGGGSYGSMDQNDATTGGGGSRRGSSGGVFASLLDVGGGSGGDSPLSREWGQPTASSPVRIVRKLARMLSRDTNSYAPAASAAPGGDGGPAPAGTVTIPAPPQPAGAGVSARRRPPSKAAAAAATAATAPAAPTAAAAAARAAPAPPAPAQRLTSSSVLISRAPLSPLSPLNSEAEDETTSVETPVGSEGGGGVGSSASDSEHLAALFTHPASGGGGATAGHDRGGGGLGVALL